MWKEFEDQPDARMVGAPHDFPGIAVVADVAAPCQRLVADAQATLRRALAKIAKIGGDTVDATHSERRGIGADQHQVSAELLHQIEFPLGAVEGA